MTRAFSLSLAPLREQELAYSEPQAIHNPLKEWIESLYDYLFKCWEVNKCPLEYVARAQVAVKPHATDPATDYEMLIKK